MIGDNMNNDVVDLFQEELDKKQFKEEKKIAKKVAKEKKREKKKLKKLEKIEDEEFAKKLEEKPVEEEIKIEKDNVLEDIIKERSTRVEKNIIEDSEISKEKKHTFLNVILTISIIILLIVSGDYAIYNILKQKDLEIIINSSALCLLSIFYILSIIINKKGLKKFFQILATLSIAAYMCYQLFIV